MKIRTLDLRQLLPLLMLAAGTLVIAVAGVRQAFADDPAANTASTQQPEVAPLDPLAMRLDPGQWREYRYIGGANDSATVRWTWLETEQQDNVNYQWFETRMEQNGQLLVSRVLGNLDDPTAPPLRVILQTGDMAPREMAEDMRLLAAPALKRNTLYPPTKLAETKIIEVPAGTFTTTVYEVTIGGAINRTYYAEGLPGMVLFENDAGGMELVASGNDGTTAIAGEIIPYTPLPPGVKPGARPAPQPPAN